MDQLEGRNPVTEALLRERRKVRRIWLDQGAKVDRKVARILELAAQHRVRVDKVPRQKLDEMADGRVHNGIVAHADPLPSYTALNLLDKLFDEGKSPFLVMADEVNYEHNLGALLRTGLGMGIDGLIMPTRRGATVSSVVSRVSMGGAEIVPVVREGLSSALKHVKKAGIKVVGADMGGVPLQELDLRGPLCIILGGEGKGLSPALRKKCDHIVSIPLAGDLESLNVSVAGALLMYEKRRQDGWFDQKGDEQAIDEADAHDPLDDIL